jgi:hypothetical protein
MFHERERTDIEERFGVRLVRPENDRWSYNRGMYVNVHLQGTTYSGLYQGTTDKGSVLLFPSLRSPIERIDEERFGYGRLIIEDSRPNSIEAGFVIGMSPITNKEFGAMVGREYSNGPLEQKA